MEMGMHVTLLIPAMLNAASSASERLYPSPNANPSFVDASVRLVTVTASLRVPFGAEPIKTKFEFVETPTNTLDSTKRGSAP